MLPGVHYNSVFVVVCALIVAGVVQAPVDEASILRRWHIQHAKRIDMSVHPVIVLLRHVYTSRGSCFGCSGVADSSFLCCTLHSEISCDSGGV